MASTALIDIEKAALLRSINRPITAMETVQKAVDFFAEGGYQMRLAQARLLLAECQREVGQSGEAREGYRSILQMPGSLRLPSLAYRAYYGLGRLEDASRRPRNAYRYYRAAVRQIETIERSLRVDEFRASFREDKLEVYQAAVQSALGQGKVEEAFGYVERSKSSALLDWLARQLEVQAEEGQPATQEAWERLRKLKEEWTWRYSRLEGLPPEEKGDNFRGEVPDDQAWKELSQIEGQIKQVLRQLQGSRYLSLAPEAQPSWQAISPYLEPDTLVIEYFCLGDEILAFLVTSAGLGLCRSFPYLHGRGAPLAGRAGPVPQEFRGTGPDIHPRDPGPDDPAPSVPVVHGPHPTPVRLAGRHPQAGLPAPRCALFPALPRLLRRRALPDRALRGAVRPQPGGAGALL